MYAFMHAKMGCYYDKNVGPNYFGTKELTSLKEKRGRRKNQNLFNFINVTWKQKLCFDKKGKKNPNELK